MPEAMKYWPILYTLQTFPRTSQVLQTSRASAPRGRKIGGILDKTDWRLFGFQWGLLWTPLSCLLTRDISRPGASSIMPRSVVARMSSRSEYGHRGARELQERPVKPERENINVFQLISTIHTCSYWLWQKSSICSVTQWSQLAEIWYRSDPSHEHWV